MESLEDDKSLLQHLRNKTKEGKQKAFLKEFDKVLNQMNQAAEKGEERIKVLSLTDYTINRLKKEGLRVLYYELAVGGYNGYWIISWKNLGKIKYSF